MFYYFPLVCWCRLTSLPSVKQDKCVPMGGRWSKFHTPRSGQLFWETYIALLVITNGGICARVPLRRFILHNKGAKRPHPIENCECWIGSLFHSSLAFSMPRFSAKWQLVRAKKQAWGNYYNTCRWDQNSTSFFRVIWGHTLVFWCRIHSTTIYSPKLRREAWFEPLKVLERS